MSAPRGEEQSRADEEATAWLARLRAGRRDDQQAFEDWYARDVAHADAYDRVLRSWEASGRSGETALGAARRSQQDARARGPWTAIAAILVVTLIALAVAALGLGVPGSSSAYAFETGRGQIRRVRLDDGSRVTLDTDSAVRAAFTRLRRSVRLLRGRARFDVASDPARPFVVATANAVTTTQAGVMDVALGGDRTRVTMWRGTAAVRDAAAVHTTVLGAGRSLDLDRTGGQSLPLPAHATDARWTSGMLSFEDATLGDVVAAANRYSTTRIVLGDPSLAGLRVTGTFKAGDAKGLARMVAAMFHLRCAVDDARTLVLTRPR